MKIIIFIFILIFNLSLKCNGATQIIPSIYLLLSDSTFTIQESALKKFLPGEYIIYESNGGFQDQYYVGYGSAYGCYYNNEKFDRGSGSIRYYKSSYSGEDFPSLTTISKSIHVGSFFSAQSALEISQDSSGNVIVYMCTDGSKPNFPNGVSLVESPLYINKKWSHDQYCNDILKEDYDVIGKEIINTPIGKIETFKIKYNSLGKFPNGSYFDYLVEEGFFWVHPQIGIIKQSFTINNMPYCRFKLCCHEKYNIEMVLKSTNIDLSRLTQNQ